MMNRVAGAMMKARQMVLAKFTRVPSAGLTSYKFKEDPK